MQTLYDIKVTDKQSFIDFLKLLSDDFAKHPENWEHRNLGDFLQNMADYTEDIQGYYNNTDQPIDSEVASWKVFYDILMGARIYE